jgi:hypothetical protein
MEPPGFRARAGKRRKSTHSACSRYGVRRAPLFLAWRADTLTCSTLAPEIDNSSLPTKPLKLALKRATHILLGSESATLNTLGVAPAGPVAVPHSRSLPRPRRVGWKTSPCCTSLGSTPLKESTPSPSDRDSSSQSGDAQSAGACSALFALARLDSLLREQCAIEEGDDALFVLGGPLADRLGVVDVWEIPELDRVTRGLRVDEV